PHINHSTALKLVAPSRGYQRPKWSVPNLPSGYGVETWPVPKCRHENSTKERNMTTQFTTKRASQTLFVILIAVCFGATLASVHAQKPGAMKSGSRYQVSTLPDFV